MKKQLSSIKLTYRYLKSRLEHSNGRVVLEQLETWCVLYGDLSRTGIRFACGACLYKVDQIYSFFKFWTTLWAQSMFDSKKTWRTI